MNSGEEVLANNSSDTFLIGYSTKNPFIENFWNSVFIEFQKTKIPHAVWIDSDLDGNNDISGLGLLSDEFTGSYDIDGDGIYDIIRQISQERSEYDEVNQVEFALNTTFDAGNFIIGAKLDYSSYSSDYDITYDMNYIYHDIEENFDDYIENQLDDSSDHYLSSFFDFQTSILLPDFRGYEIRGDFIFMHQNNSSDDQINDYYREDYFDLNIPDIEDFNITEDVSKNITERPGNAFTLGTSIRKTLVKAAQRKNDGYWKIGGGITLGPGAVMKGTSKIISGGSVLELKGNIISGDLPAVNLPSTIRQTIIIWVGFRFANTEVEVLPLLQLATKEVEQLANDIYLII